MGAWWCWFCGRTIEDRKRAPKDKQGHLFCTYACRRDHESPHAQEIQERMGTFVC